MTTKHTPTPWHQGTLTGQRSYIFSPDGRAIIQACEKRSDVELIIKAVNSHAELLEALEGCLTMDGATAERSHEMALKRLRAINELATAALKAAKGE